MSISGGKKIQHTVTHTVVGNLAASLIPTNIWMTCVSFSCCPYQGIDIIGLQSPRITHRPHETLVKILFQDKLLFLNNYCAT